MLRHNGRPSPGSQHRTATRQQLRRAQMEPSVLHRTLQMSGHGSFSSPSSSPVRTPSAFKLSGSPNRSSKSPRYSDRFIPTRSSTSLADKFSLLKSTTPETNTYSLLLQNELLPEGGNSLNNKRNLFSYRTPEPKKRRDSPFSLSPIGENSKRLLLSRNGSVSRKIPKEPFKTLEAPAIQVNKLCQFCC